MRFITNTKMLLIVDCIPRSYLKIKIELFVRIYFSEFLSIKFNNILLHF